jgi:very long chain acyl-CoA dehydrogenase
MLLKVWHFFWHKIWIEEFRNINVSIVCLLSFINDCVSVFLGEAAIGKIFASESAWFVLDEAIQIHGGMGFMKSTGLERVMRDLRIFRIFEGANDILRLFVGFTGLQYVGLHLRELQTAVKNFNFNVIVGESSKRLRRGMGMSSGPNINEHVHSSLQSSGLLLSKSIDRFGAMIEQILIKHGKTIRDEQFIVHRIGEITIDLYSMAASLSRCTQSFRNQSPSAVHEANLVRIWCEESYDKINNNIKLIQSSAFIERTRLMSELARELVDKESTVPVHPLGF